VGYKAVSSLEKVRHRIPLLSLDKTKIVSELASFVKDHAALLMLKLDGLTVKLVYEGGKLVEGSTRGDGDEGELIAHNIADFRNVPLSIPYKQHLALSGEGFIHKGDFERLKDTPTGSDGKPYRNARNLDSGSIRCLDANICKEREISFFAFNILEGMNEFEDDTYETVFRSIEWQPYPPAFRPLYKKESLEHQRHFRDNAESAHTAWHLKRLSGFIPP